MKKKKKKKQVLTSYIYKKVYILIFVTYEGMVDIDRWKHEMDQESIYLFLRSSGSACSVKIHFLYIKDDISKAYFDGKTVASNNPPPLRRI